MPFLLSSPYTAGRSVEWSPCAFIPLAAVTHDHTVHGFKKNPNILYLSLGAAKSRVCFPGLKSRCPKNSIPSRGSGKKPLSYLLQLLEATCIPCLMNSSFLFIPSCPSSLRFSLTDAPAFLFHFQGCLWLHAVSNSWRCDLQSSNLIMVQTQDTFCRSYFRLQIWIFSQASDVRFDALTVMRAYNQHNDNHSGPTQPFHFSLSV